MIDRTMMQGPLRVRSAVIAGVIASGTVLGCVLAALAVTVARWAFASQPLVTML